MYRLKKIIKIIIPVLCVFAVIFTIHNIPNGKLEISDVKKVSQAQGEKLVALTFDDGPNKNTKILLNGLHKRNVKATFFILGKKAEKNENIIIQMYKDGHLIGNHTYSHKNFLKTKTDVYLDEINRTNDIIKNITGEDALFFRPPYGKYDGLRIKNVNKISIAWSLDIIDWKHKDAAYVYNKLVKNVKDGDIILMHDVNKTTVEGVLRAIDDLSEQGFEFVRVDELLNRNGKSIKSGVVYRGCKYEKNQFIF